MKVAIIGANGFIGKKLCKYLLKLNFSVDAFVISKPLSGIPSVNYIQVENFLANSPHENDYDLLINLAAKRSTIFETYDSSIVQKYTLDLPVKLCEKILRGNCKMINFSTYIQNYEGRLGNAIDDYSKNKQEFSNFIQNYADTKDIRILDLYLFTIYGSGDKQQHLIPTLINAAQFSTKVKLSPGNQLINLLHVDDLIQNTLAVLNMSFDSNYRAYSVWDDNYLTLRELVREIEKILNLGIDCEWGARTYSGHEMLSPWPRVVEKLPHLITNINLQDGISSILKDAQLMVKTREDAN